jgi:hypothetical protein
MAPKGLDGAFITKHGGTNYIEYSQGKEKYNEVLTISTKDPRCETENVIRSFFSTMHLEHHHRPSSPSPGTKPLGEERTRNA